MGVERACGGRVVGVERAWSGRGVGVEWACSGRVAGEWWACGGRVVGVWCASSGPTSTYKHKRDPCISTRLELVVAVLPEPQLLEITDRLGEEAEDPPGDTNQTPSQGRRTVHTSACMGSTKHVWGSTTDSIASTNQHPINTGTTKRSAHCVFPIGTLCFGGI